MKSEELAQEVAGICAEAQRRILFVGHASYASGRARHEHQRFETETLEDELHNLEEELMDTINWAAMSILKLRQRRERATPHSDTTR